MRVLVLVALVACGSSKRVPTSGATAATPVTSPRTACPAAFALARGTCTSGAGCTYPEGTCQCAPAGPIECSGGAAVRPDPNPPSPPPPPPLAWQCTPAVRADGCPGTEPEGACTSEGKQCRYGACCVSEHTCTNGQWTITMMACPP